MTPRSTNGHGPFTIVIGAGVNSLTTAAYLARAGRRVLVLERRHAIGGSAVTEEFAPGFRADSCVHDVGWISPQIVADLNLAAHGLKLLTSSWPVLAPAGDGRLLRLHRSLSRTAESLSAFSAADAAHWPRFAERIAKLAGFLESLYANPAPNVEATSFADIRGLLGAGWRLRQLGKAAMVDLLRTLPMSVAELLDDAFESDVLKGTLGAEGIRHLCQGPRAGATAFTLLHHQVGRPAGAFHSSCVPLGGVGELARSLAASAIAAGAQIRTGSEVAKIVTHEGRASGVVLTTGEEFVTNGVISGADPRRTFLQLLDPTALAPEFVSAVRNIRFRGVWAKVNLALDNLPVLTGATADEMREVGAISISPSLDYLEQAYDDAKYGRVSDRPYLDVRIPSLANPGFAPPGKHVISVHMQYAPYHLRAGPWDRATRDALGDHVIATLGNYLPGLSESVVHQQVLTPLDLETEYALPEGHAYHGEMTLDQILFMRPVAGHSRHRTPLRDLYLCGPGTHPGGAIAGGAGANAAREVIASERRGAVK